LYKRLFALAVLLAASAAFAQPYPSKPVRIIVPFPPGGAVDILGRAIAERMGAQMGHNVYVENRAGGAGAVGAEAAARSAPDGYSLFMGSTTTLSINPHLFSKLPYDSQKDYAAVAQVAFVPHILVANAQLPASNLREFIALAKKEPGKINYASAGNGTPHHIAGEMFKQMAGVNLVHVPYKGTGPALPDLISGQVSFMSVEILAAMPHVQSGKLRALGMATPRRVPSAPEIPTTAEAGLPGFEVTAWYGVVAPAGTSTEIIEFLSKEIEKAVASRELQDRLNKMGATPAASKPAEFADFMRREYAKWGKAVKESGAKVD
jgi:tripartite-type tricarboxylate transporter receptor subunit TctC